MIGRHLVNQWNQIRAESFHLNPLLLGIAQLGFLVGILILPYGGWILARRLDAPVSKASMWHAFNLGMVAKYLPGSVWSLPSRAVLYRGLGITRNLEVIYWETGLMVVAATGVALLGLPLFIKLDVFLAIILLLGGGSSAFLVGSWLLKRGQFSGWLPEFDLQLSLPSMIAALLIYAVAWIILGLSFMVMIHATGGEWNAYTIGLFAGGWAVGFLSILTPGGIGIRDGILIIGVGIFATDPVPLVAAILARICWTIAEVCALLLTYYNKRHEANHPNPMPE